MKRFVGYVTSWLLYGMGHSVFVVMDFLGWGWLYRTYSRLMIASCEVQDWGGSGPWNDD